MKDSLHLGKDAVASRMRDMVYLMIKGVEAPLDVSVGGPPFVIMVLGVNGVGKTTTIGKLALRLGLEGKSVIIGAADTFRAAAIEQLEIWGSAPGALS